MYGIIYKAVNTANQKIYIGQTTRSLEERKYYHNYRALNEPEITTTHFINAIRKYGINNFEWSIIDSAQNKDELNKKEIHWINYYDSVNNGYNMQNGGNQMITDKFVQACGGRPFLAYRTNGEFLGRYINQKDFSRKYNIADTHVSDLINNKYISCNGFVIIAEEDFSEEKLQEKLSKAKNTYRPFIAINLKTFEEYGPFISAKECRESLHLKNNHIGEILKGQRKSQEGYTFKFLDIKEG